MTLFDIEPMLKRCSSIRLYYMSGKFIALMTPYGTDEILKTFRGESGTLRGSIENALTNWQEDRPAVPPTVQVLFAGAPFVGFTGAVKP